jgi:hypothetical protein
MYLKGTSCYQPRSIIPETKKFSGTPGACLIARDIALLCKPVELACAAIKCSDIVIMCLRYSMAGGQLDTCLRGAKQYI